MDTPVNADESQVEVFATRDAMTAQAAIDEVLEPEGIDAVIHDRVSHILPAPATMFGGYFVAVPRSQAAAALTLLREAVSDGAVEGEVLAPAAAASSA
jgi:hypothetical protein